MDEALIALWNVVRKGDLVWHLGDCTMRRGVDIVYVIRNGFQ